MKYIVSIGRENDSKLTFRLEMPDDIENDEEEWEGILDKIRGRYCEIYRNTHPSWVDNLGDIDAIIYKEQFATKLGRLV